MEKQGKNEGEQQIPRLPDGMNRDSLGMTIEEVVNSEGQGASAKLQLCGMRNKMWGRGSFPKIGNVLAIRACKRE
jgi:hypothetical protein